MSELIDYSGDFNPNMKLEDFSKEALIELLRVYSKLYIAADGFWYLAVKERISNEEALACDMWVWERGTKYEMNKITKSLKIHGDDVIAVMKALQMTPWFRHCQYKMDILNRNEAIFTMTHCPTLEALEKEGEGREETICKVVEPMLLNKYAEFFNPNMKVRYLKLPPRRSKEEICCQWEFKIG